MITLGNMKLFLVESLPDSPERRAIIEIIDIEIDKANGDANAVVTRQNKAESLQYMQWKNRQHIAIEAAKNEVFTPTKIKISGTIDPDIYRCGLREGDTVEALVSSLTKEAKIAGKLLDRNVVIVLQPNNYTKILSYE